MTQSDAWEKEYRRPQLLTGRDAPQNDVLRFFKFLRKKCGLELENLNILDLGSGTGRNSNYLGELGNTVVGMEISPAAIKIAQKRAEQMGVKIQYLQHSIGTVYPFKNSYFDIILDITSSNSLNEKGRTVYLQETQRVLKPGGYFFVRALCKDADKNAKNLLKISPGMEYDTYFMKELGLTERVFSEEDFWRLYGQYFEIEKLMKKKGYARLNGQNYKRIYWLAYLSVSNRPKGLTRKVKGDGSLLP